MSNIMDTEATANALVEAIAKKTAKAKTTKKAKVVTKKVPAKATKKVDAKADSNVCTVAAIARELGMSEKVARAKCRRNRDFFKKLPRLADAPGVWTFKASAKPQIRSFLEARAS